MKKFTLFFLTIQIEHLEKYPFPLERIISPQKPYITQPTKTRWNASTVMQPGAEEPLQGWCGTQLPCHCAARPHCHLPSWAPTSQAWSHSQALALRLLVLFFSCAEISDVECGGPNKHLSFCPSLSIPDSPSSCVRYSLPYPRDTAELFTVKGKCPAVQNVPICWQDKPNQNHEPEHPMNYLPFIILTADSSVSAFSERTVPGVAGLMVMLVSGSGSLWFI